LVEDRKKYGLHRQSQVTDFAAKSRTPRGRFSQLIGIIKQVGVITGRDHALLSASAVEVIRPN
jgi:hypothetical protein